MTDRLEKRFQINIFTRRMKLQEKNYKDKISMEHFWKS